MVFTEPRFFAFLAVVFVAHWALRGMTARKWLLLCASYAFYSAWDWRFSSLLLFSTLLDYVAGLMIAKAPTQSGRRRWITLSLAGNLGILGFFKYYDFFVESTAAALSGLGVDVSPPVLNVVVPVGVSFYTFQTLSYAIDVYRGTLKPCTSLLDFALFVAFFPQLVAGPIVRAADFLPQLTTPRGFHGVPVRACVGLFLVGYFKKACVADHLAVQVDRVFDAPSQFSSADNWLGAILYQVQVYCDFSGYSDMALATAGLFGYRLMLNFDFPYFASNIGEFWRRWHISLSTWLRDYLYISLGGSRVATWRGVVNVLVTFTLCGLWHGAAWNFVVFGAIHGGYVMAHVAWRSLVATRPRMERVSSWIGIPTTNLAFLLSLVVFRSTSWQHCAEMFDRMFRLGVGGIGGAESVNPGFLPLVVLLAFAHYVAYRGRVTSAFMRASDPVAACLLGAGWAAAFFLAAAEYQPFIYFQF